VIYLDKLRKYKRQSYCHMMSDVSIGELHHFALKIGVARHWFHGEHYDLRALERGRALIAGARETTSKGLVEIRRRHYSK